ncbi:hypothetical protein X971_0411 [Agrobacterium tumefaciens LBA4213 (Ach5)]|nr:hypothetical protein X971_0411 [Agrobacterium tumefaciens LBA4213 (Ach5)]
MTYQWRHQNNGSRSQSQAAQKHLMQIFQDMPRNRSRPTFIYGRPQHLN